MTMDIKSTWSKHNVLITLTQVYAVTKKLRSSIFKTCSVQFRIIKEYLQLSGLHACKALPAPVEHSNRVLK